jgi:hypothetical protein
MENAMTGADVTFDEVAAAADSVVSDGKQATVDAVHAILDSGSTAAIHRHLAKWRASRAKPAPAPTVEIPPQIAAALGSWVQQYAEEAGLGARDALAQSESDMEPLLQAVEQLEAEREALRAQLATVTAAHDQALETVAGQAESIGQLTAELRNARLIATDALVGKAKDQLAIDGKDRQVADLRAQVERNLADSAAQSDARLAAEMELVGAVTARDNFAAEIKELRAQLDARHAARGG